MLTTVVGSYPVSDPPVLESISSKISNFLGRYDPYLPMLELAVKDQISAGVDIISDGQVRGDMIQVFARHLPGMGVENDTSKIFGKIRPANHSLGGNDLELALKIAQKTSNDFLDINKSDSKLIDGNNFNKHFKGVKGIITGPTTLVLSSRIEGFYNRDKKGKIIRDMAMALKQEAYALQEAGAAIIQIDEPYLSTGIADLKTAKDAIKIITDNLSIPVSIHVCGDIGDVFNELLKFSVQIIDCEFAGLPNNLRTLEQKYDGSKKIGFGCIDTKVDGVDELDHVVNLIKKGIDIIGEENIMLDPDCGMRMLSRNMALLKLRKMTEAVGWF
jgi:5-methyltetrahydropteroyltriglutamate--homocysteine methyltransferase